MLINFKWILLLLLLKAKYLKRKKKNCLIYLGGLGQLGIECAKSLRKVYGSQSVILSDIVKPNEEILENGPYIFADILDFKVGLKINK